MIAEGGILNYKTRVVNWGGLGDPRDNGGRKGTTASGGAGEVEKLN